MLDEINKDFYCSANCYHPVGKCALASVCLRCENYHRKHPTPEQFKEEYGKEVPDTLPMWVWCEDKYNGDDWLLIEARRIKQIYRTHDPLFVGEIEINEKSPVVCACAPFGKPDENWRPM